MAGAGAEAQQVMVVGGHGRREDGARSGHRGLYGASHGPGEDPADDAAAEEDVIDILSYLANVRSGTDSAAGPDAGSFSSLRPKILGTVAALLLGIIAVFVIAAVLT